MSEVTKQNPAKKNSPKSQGSRVDQFLHWIENCTVVYDYRNPSKDKFGKEQRLKSLKSLCEFVEVPDNVTKYFMPFLDLVIEMLQQSLFRVLPPEERVVEQMTVEDTGKLDFSWQDDPTFPYIEDCYRLFTSLLGSPNAKIKVVKHFITPSFIQALLGLFASREAREHECLVQLVHRLYLKIIPRRKMMRKAIRECMIVMAQDDQPMNGTSALLNFMASYISGFALPLRAEHQLFFTEMLVPLHYLTENPMIHSELLRCTMLFLAKDPGLDLPLVHSLLRHWPIVNARKQVLFLQEIREVLDTCGMSNLAPIVGKLIQRVAWCMTQQHYQLVYEALSLVTENPTMAMVLQTYKTVAYPILVPTLSAQESNSALLPMIRNGFDEVGKMLRSWDPEMYEMSLTIEPKRGQDNREKWEALEARAKQLR